MLHFAGDDAGGCNRTERSAPLPPNPGGFLFESGTIPCRDSRGDYRNGFLQTFGGCFRLALLVEPFLARGFSLFAACVRGLILQQELLAALVRASLAAISISTVAPQVQVEFPLACQTVRFA